MWFTGIALEDGRHIEARHRAGRWRWRLVAPGARGPFGLPLAAVVGPTTDDLEDLIVRVRDVAPRSVTASVIEPLGDALDNMVIEDAWVDRWREQLDEHRRRALAFRRSCAALQDLLRLALPRAHVEGDPILHRVTERLLRVMTGPDWGEAGTRRAPVRSIAGGNYQSAVFAFRRDHVDRLPYEDLDALLGDDVWLFERRDDRLALHLDRLLSLRPRFERHAGLLSPPTDDVVVATGRAGARTYTLVCNDRRWGLSGDGDDARMLPPGIGAELALRLAGLATLPAHDPGVVALHRDIVALADAVRLGASPHAGLTVLVHPGREVQARWRRGEWQWRALQLVHRDGAWVRGRGRTSWRRGAASVLTTDLRARYVPAYLHPVVAPHARDALALERSLFGPRYYEDRAWDALLDEACAGRIAGTEGDPYAPRWVFATDEPFPITLAGRTWPSIDAAVAEACARPDGVASGRAVLWAALEAKHREELVPHMVLTETGDAPITAPSRWDGVLGDNVVGEMLMKIRALRTRAGRP
jgi:hypothetical protein